ncbi:MAG: polyphenol oxidase family protein [Acidimicrobiales bacterium]
MRFTQASDGDLRVGQPRDQVEATRRRVLDLPWTWLHQVHGDKVVAVGHPGQWAGADADAAVTDQPGAALAIHTADCVPLALVGPDGVVGAVHAGWRGLAAGVVEATVHEMRRLGAGDIHGVVGPCIHAECYEFGPAELAAIADRYGPEVVGRTGGGTPALDMPAAVTAALRQADVADVEVVPVCTACDRSFFSHRARGDIGRQALLVWTDEP